MKFRLKISFANYYIVLLAFIAISTSSCTSHKDFMLFTDLDPNNKINIPNNYSFTHKIRPGDNLHINIVTSNADLNKIYNPAMIGALPGSPVKYDNESGQYINGYNVNDDGYINIPVIGDLNVLGLTLEQCEGLIKHRIVDYLKEANVKVRLLSYKITVFGEVNDPGVYYNFGGGSYTILDAISEAGGFTEDAEIRNISILRRSDDGKRYFELDLSSSSSITSKGYFLYPEDVIIINPSKRKTMVLRKPFFDVSLSTATIVAWLIAFALRQ